MKAYTDLQQGKKLMMILPLESADFYYSEDKLRPMIITEEEITYAKTLYDAYDMHYLKIFGYTPCWSLAALLEVLPRYIGDYGKCLYYDIGGYYCGYMYDGDFMSTIEETNADNPVDSCVEMILKLHQKELL